MQLLTIALGITSHVTYDTCNMIKLHRDKNAMGNRAVGVIKEIIINMNVQVSLGHP